MNFRFSEDMTTGIITTPTGPLVQMQLYVNLPTTRKLWESTQGTQISPSEGGIFFLQTFFRTELDEGVCLSNTVPAGQEHATRSAVRREWKRSWHIAHPEAGDGKDAARTHARTHAVAHVRVPCVPPGRGSRWTHCTTRGCPGFHSRWWRSREPAEGRGRRGSELWRPLSVSARPLNTNMAAPEH